MYFPLPNYLGLHKSSIHGYGVFAKQSISRGTILGISHVQHDLFPDGWIRTPLGGFYNHSENPNCELIDDKMDDGFITKIKLLRAIKNISIGTEITCTYTIWKATSEMKKSPKENLSDFSYIEFPWV